MYKELKEFIESNDIYDFNLNDYTKNELYLMNNIIKKDNIIETDNSNILCFIGLYYEHKKQDESKAYEYYLKANNKDSIYFYAKNLYYSFDQIENHLNINNKKSNNIKDNEFSNSDNDNDNDNDNDDDDLINNADSDDFSSSDSDDDLINDSDNDLINNNNSDNNNNILENNNNSDNNNNILENNNLNENDYEFLENNINDNTKYKIYLKKALELESEKAMIFYAHILQDNNKDNISEKFYLKAIELNYKPVYIYYARFLKNRNRINEAKIYYLLHNNYNIENKNYDDLYHLCEYIDILIKEDKYEKAEKYLLQNLKYKNVRLIIKYIELLYNQKRKQKAKKYFIRYLDWFKNLKNNYAIFNLIEDYTNLLLKDNKINEAKEYILIYIKYFNNNNDNYKEYCFIRKYVEILIEEKKLEEAEKYLFQNMNNKIVYNHMFNIYGDLLKKLNKIDEAIKFYVDCIKNNNIDIDDCKNIYIKYFNLIKNNEYQAYIDFYDCNTLLAKNIIKKLDNNSEYNNDNNFIIFKNKIKNFSKIEDCGICYTNKRCIPLNCMAHLVCGDCYIKINKDKCPFCRVKIVII